MNQSTSAPGLRRAAALAISILALASCGGHGSTSSSGSGQQTSVQQQTSTPASSTPASSSSPAAQDVDLRPLVLTADEVPLSGKYRVVAHQPPVAGTLQTTLKLPIEIAFSGQCQQVHQQIVSGEFPMKGLVTAKYFGLTAIDFGTGIYAFAQPNQHEQLFTTLGQVCKTQKSDAGDVTFSRLPVPGAHVAQLAWKKNGRARTLFVGGGDKGTHGWHLTLEDATPAEATRVYAAQAAKFDKGLD